MFPVEEERGVLPLTIAVRLVVSFVVICVCVGLVVRAEQFEPSLVVVSFGGGGSA
jgi:hypothetical protein